MLDFFLYLFLGLVQIGFAVWGGVMAAKALPSTERKLHIGIFVILGVVGLGLTIAIGVSNYRAQTLAAQNQSTAAANQSRTSAELEQSRLAQEYMKGQLNSLSAVIRSPTALPIDPKQMAAYIEKISSPSTNAFVSSDKDFRRVALDLVQRMRSFETVPGGAVFYTFD